MLQNLDGLCIAMHGPSFIMHRSDLQRKGWLSG
jgi:hypothetical protein